MASIKHDLIEAKPHQHSLHGGDRKEKGSKNDSPEMNKPGNNNKKTYTHIKNTLRYPMLTVNMPGTKTAFSKQLLVTWKIITILTAVQF